MKRNQLVESFKNGEVICVSAIGLTVQYLKKGGVGRGVLLDSDNKIKRFRSDKKGWLNFFNITWFARVR